MTHYYHASIRVDGILWYHSRSQPSSQYYISQSLPIFHNYGLTLALAGYIVDPGVGYASVFGVTKYKKPIELFKDYGVYAYPAAVSRAILGEVLMAGNNEGLAMIRGQTRLAYPFFTKNVALMPGSELRTMVMSEERLPPKLVVRVGAKRGGVLLVRLKPVNPRKREYARITHPFNVADVGGVKEYTVLLTHGAGDIAVFGLAEEAIEYTYVERGRRHRAVLPLVRGS